jgi:predicted Zn-dependent peptidase
VIAAALAAALLLAAPRPAPPRPAAPLPSSVRLADGLEIVVVTLPGAARASLRLVVRAGGAADPASKAGLAHLVEHLVMKGSYDEDGTAFDDDARRAGATVNAHTRADLTKVELDAPAAAFPRLAERLVRMVTSPAWELASVSAELGVLETEARYHGSEGTLSLVDRAVFPAPDQPGPLAGTRSSRSGLDADDAARFFSTRWIPSSMAIVFAGPLRLDEARAMVERSFRIPPALPSEAPPPAEDEPLLGHEQKIPGGVNLTLVGYALRPEDVAACEAVAALVELRLALALQAEGPLLLGIAVGCPVLRGQPFVVATAYGTTLDVGDLPASLDGALRGLGTSPPTAAERAAVDARLDAQDRRLLSQPDLVAERVAGLLAFRGDPRPLAARLLQPRLPSAAELGRLVARSLAPGRRIVVNVSPTYQ